MKPEPPAPPPVVFLPAEELQTLRAASETLASCAGNVARQFATGSITEASFKVARSELTRLRGVLDRLDEKVP